MKNKEYWIARAMSRENEAYLRGAALSAKTFQEYNRAAGEIRRHITDFYSRYAGKHGLTYEQAVRLLTRSEWREWKADLDYYVRRIAAEPDPRVKALLTAHLDALSTNSRISRLEALLGQIDLSMNDLYERTVAELRDEFGAVLEEGYYKKLYDLQTRAGFFNEIAAIDEDVVEAVLTYPWSGAMFSDRLWQNKQALLFHIRETITQGMIQGISVPEMAKEISGRMGQSYKAAERLIRTETAYVHGESDKVAYKAAGVDQYEYVATLDSRTSEICASLDGKIFPVKDARVGVNYPPMHPNCRSTTVEHDPDDALDWYNSGLKMPDRMTYEEWYEKQTAQHGAGFVEKEREKAYNKKADAAQFGRYAERLGADVPADLDAFQEMKYTRPEEWAETKSFYAYKGRVPEATKPDFRLHGKIVETGIYGTVRVPPAAIDPSSLTLDVAHTMRKHSVTEEEARSFVADALFSIRRRHQTGKVFVNYYSSAGASYVLEGDNLIRTAFKRDQFKPDIIKVVEVAESEIR